MKKAYIKSVSYVLPDQELSNDDLVDLFPEWGIDKITSKIGIQKRFVSAIGETAGDLAEKAAIKLFEEHDVNPSSIDFVLLCSQSPDYFLPTTACILQDKLKIPTTAGALDFNLGCSGYIYGLALAKGLIVSGIANNILLLTAETYTKHIHPSDKGNRSIFGDAAAATIVSSMGFAEIMDFELGTDGSGYKNLIIETGGLRHKERMNDFAFGDNPISSDYIYMNGTEIFNFTLEKVPPLIEQTLLKNKIERNKIEYFIFHQANKYMLEFIRKKLKIDPEKFIYFMESVGNTVSSTIPIALCETIKVNNIKGYVLLAGFGVGYSWGATIIKF